MSIPHRRATPSSVLSGERTFFVTSSTRGKRAILQSSRSAGLFIDVLHHYRREQKYSLHEFVVMPDHFHLLVTISHGMTIERALQFIKGGFAYRAGKELGMQAPVWQKGFSETRIETREAYRNAREYIYSNPVKKGLAVSPSEFPYSSANPTCELDPPPQRLKPHLQTKPYGIAKAMP